MAREARRARGEGAETSGERNSIGRGPPLSPLSPLRAATAAVQLHTERRRWSSEEKIEEQARGTMTHTPTRSSSLSSAIVRVGRQAEARNSFLWIVLKIRKQCVNK